jgi:hypothetical protein
MTWRELEITGYPYLVPTCGTLIFFPFFLEGKGERGDGGEIEGLKEKKRKKSVYVLYLEWDGPWRSNHQPNSRFLLKLLSGDHT